MNNFLKKVLKRVKTEFVAVEQEVEKLEAVVEKFAESDLWKMARTELEKLATTQGIATVKKTSDAIIVELKKLGLVK